MLQYFLDEEGLEYFKSRMLEVIESQVKPSSGVESFNNRTGIVTPQSGDYTADMVGAVPTSRTVNGKPLSSNISLTASDVSALPISGGTLTGNLIIKGSGNYGTKINLGDGDYVHISEPTDDCMEIKAKKVNILTSDTTSTGLTWNGNSIAGGGSSVHTGSYVGTETTTLTIDFGFQWSTAIVCNIYDNTHAQLVILMNGAARYWIMEYGSVGIVTTYNITSTSNTASLVTGYGTTITGPNKSGLTYLWVAI